MRLPKEQRDTCIHVYRAVSEIFGVFGELLTLRPHFKSEIAKMIDLVMINLNNLSDESW